MRIYIAAPLFSEVERSLNDSIRAAVPTLFEVHLPQTHGPLVEREIADGVSPREAALRAYESDVAAIRSSDVMIAVFDGRVPDEGVCIEVGFARALGKHIIGFKSDVRRALPWGNNPMIEGSVDVWICDVRALVEYLGTLSTSGRV